MTKITVVGGDFIQHPESHYAWGNLTLWGWKPGKTKPSQFVLSINDHVVQIGLRSSGFTIPGLGAAGGAAAGAARGALTGSGGGPVAFATGIVLGAVLGAVMAQSAKDVARSDVQRFEIEFTDGRRLLADAPLRIVSELQDKVAQARRKKPLTVTKVG